MLRGIQKSQWLTIALLAGAIIAVAAYAISQLSYFAYPLDDTYIHMAHGRTLAESGVWGVSPHRFTASSSSPLFTVLLSIFWAIGLGGIWLPIVLTFVAFVVLVLAVPRYAGMDSSKAVLLFLAALLLYVPALPLVSSGMEHVFHALFVLMALAEFIRHDGNDYSPTKLFLWLTLAGGFRYESLFVGIAFGIVFALKRDFRSALMSLIAPWLIPVLYGLFAISQGSGFFPNTILLKGTKIPFYAYSYYWLEVLWAKKQMIPPFLSAVILLYMNRGNKLKWSSLFLLLTFMAHLSSAGIGWFFRYEAYLLVCLSLMAAMTLREYTKSWKSIPILTLIILALPMLYRSYIGISRSFTMPVSIGNTQVKQGMFLADNYGKNNVWALGDIGAPAYYSDVKIVDLNGLASADMAQLILKDGLDKDDIQTVCKENSVEYAIIYGEWAELMPADLTKVAADTTLNTTHYTEWIFDFYSVPEKEDSLRVAVSRSEIMRTKNSLWIAPKAD